MELEGWLSFYDIEIEIVIRLIKYKRFIFFLMLSMPTAVSFGDKIE